MPAVKQSELDRALSNAHATRAEQARKLREDFPFAAQMGNELRAEGFKSARVRWATESGREYRRAK